MHILQGYKSSNSETKSAIKNKQKKFVVEYLEILKTLSDKFPKVFIKGEVKVLKLGIHKDIKERTDLKSREIGKFFRKYCNSKAYKEAHVESANRYDLDGNVVGVVTAEEMAKKQKPLDNYEHKKL